MPVLVYVGPHDGVDVLGRTVLRGESAKFTAAEAATLGPDWVPPTPSKSEKES